jgi:hypothetical protein
MARPVNGEHLFSPRKSNSTRIRAGRELGELLASVAASVGPLIVGFALPRYGISGVFLVFPSLR